MEETLDIGKTIKAYLIDADLKGISIYVFNNIDEFIDMMGKYISIV